MPTKFKRRWVFIQFSEDGLWEKAFIEAHVKEAGYEAYSLRWESGGHEYVFVGSVHRIVLVEPKVIEMNLKLVNDSV